MRPALSSLLCAILLATGRAPATSAPSSTVLVSFAKDVPREDAGRILAQADVDVMAWLPGGAAVRTGGDLAPRQLRSLPGVVAVARDGLVSVEGKPSDPRFPEQWNLEQASDADIDARKGWARAFGVGPGGHTRFPLRSTGPMVGVIDTGVDLAHPDLRGTLAACGRATDGAVARGGCDDDHGHGTAMAGILAARTDNGRGIAAVGPGLRLAVCKALDADGTGAWSHVLACAGWLSRLGVPVISMSFTGSFNPVAEAAFEALWDGGRGPLLVSATGNGGIHATSYPAGFETVVSVGATNRWDGRWPFSNMNPDVEVSAPGQDILSTRKGGGYAAVSGTSIAVPHAAAVSGLVSGIRPGWAGSELRDLLTASAEDLGIPGRDGSFGWGRVNLARAVALARP